MRTGTLLCSLTTEGMEPLGAFNQPVYRGYGQLRAALLNELGALHADYFARPDTDASGKSIGWLAHDSADARRWVDLSPEEKTRLQPVLQRVQSGFAGYLTQLEAAPANSPRNNFAKLLAQALCAPGQEFLYIVGEQPVLAFWGFKPMKAAEGVDPLRISAGSTILGGTGAAVAPAAVPPVAVVAVEARKRRWWLWLLLLALALLLAALLGFWLWRNHVREQEAELRRLISTLPGGEQSVVPQPPPGVERKTVPALNPPVPVVPPPGVDVVPPVRPSGVDVVPPVRVPGVDVVPPVRGAGGDLPGVKLPVVPPGPPRPLTGPGTDQVVPPIGRPATDGGGQGRPLPPLPPLPFPPIGAPGQQTGNVPPVPVPSGLPPLPPFGGPAPQAVPLTMPANPTPGMTDFVQGVWRSRSGLMLNGKPAEEYYRFDKNGQGDVTLRTRDGSTECTGAAQAAVGADRHLSLKEAPQLACSDGSTVAGAVTDCASGSGRAVCRGTNGDGSQFGVQIEGMQGQ